MLDETKPVWILKDARPYGPFSICLVGRDHVIVKAPYDKRLWVDAHRVKEEKFIRREIFPISCVTQDENDAIAWRERNEPKIGDLVSIVYQEYISMSSQIHGVPPVRKIRLSFLTVVSPPVHVVSKLSEKFPDLVFDLKYWECGVGYKGHRVYQDGNPVKVWESQSYRGNRGG